MNAETWEQLKSLFHSALEVDEGHRAAFLDQACEGNAELRSRIERLLASHEEAGSFLVSPALLGDCIDITTTFSASPSTGMLALCVTKIS